MKRLRRFYADHFASETSASGVDVYVILRDAPTAGMRPELFKLASTLAEQLIGDRGVSLRVRRIACIAARTDAEPVVFDALFAFGPGCRSVG